MKGTEKPRNNTEKYASTNGPFYEVSDEIMEIGVSDTADGLTLREGAAQSDARGRLILSFAGASEQGSRFHNDDSFLIRDNKGVLSDGINGADYGDLLSRLCCSAFLDDWETVCNASSPPERYNLDRDRLGERLVRSAFQLVDGFVSRVSDYLGRGSGATLLTATRWGNDLVLGSVGDTAAFIFDESGGVARVMEDDGRARGGGNALSAAMGYHIVDRDESRVQTARIPLVANQRLVLCTDGVWTQLSTKHMAEILAESSDPYVSASQLTREAAAAGGPHSDNATAVVINVGDCSEIDKTPMIC